MTEKYEATFKITYTETDWKTATNKNIHILQEIQECLNGYLAKTECVALKKVDSNE